MAFVGFVFLCCGLKLVWFPVAIIRISAYITVPFALSVMCSINNTHVENKRLLSDYTTYYPKLLKCADNLTLLDLTRVGALLDQAD